MSTDRRNFLQLLTSGAMSAAFSGSIGRALAIPANRRTGTIADVEHIVVLTQENRSFDQFFGTLRGVRGFSDPRAVKLPSGKPVWYQPSDSGDVLPFRPVVSDMGTQFLADVAHDWTSSHAAWDNGKYDQWIPSKGTNAMVYYTRRDIPFHYALADAFTVCDAYYCSVLGPTDPNRYHIWTGWVGNDGQGGGPVVDNAEAGYDWSSFPELLQAAGISWKVYQDAGVGLDAAGFWGWTGNDPFIGNYGDNSLLYLHQYQNAAPGSPLYQGARTGTMISNGGTLFDELQQDVLGNKLPQVSWIAAPEAYTEHPNWPPDFGAWYTSQVLDALTANPDVWSKTALFLMYDENGGFFDHMVPPTPPQTRAAGLSNIDTTNELFPGSSSYEPGPYGLGVRVPMIVISPWSKGGWVNSQVFDHTSLIQFIEARYAGQHPGLLSPNITPWRRAVAGNLKSAFDFDSPNQTKFTLPDTSAYKPQDLNRHPDFNPVPPASQYLPTQEKGLRPARPLPYHPHVWAKADFLSGTVSIEFRNNGNATIVYQVRSGNNSQGPWTYTVGPHTQIVDTWTFQGTGNTGYDLSVYGPNGFFRAFKGNFAGTANGNLATSVRTGGDGDSDSDDPTIVLYIRNAGMATAEVHIRDVYTGEETVQTMASGESFVQEAVLEKSYGWYDYIITVASDSGFEQRVAGHLENGRESMSDPALG